MNPQITEAFRAREEELPGLQADLRKRYENQEIYELLIELSELGCTLRCNSAGEEKLFVAPRDVLTPEISSAIREHKVIIVRAMQDMEFVKTGKIQCPRQAIELAKENFGDVA